MAVALAVLYLWGGPFYEQVLGGRSLLVHPWRMYGRIGDDTCRVEYARVDADGRRTPLDRFSLLGFETAQLAPRNLRVLDSPKAVREAGRRLCSAKSREVRAKLQCPKAGRFGEVEETENLCTGVRPKKLERQRGKGPTSVQHEFKRKAAP